MHTVIESKDIIQFQILDVSCTISVMLYDKKPKTSDSDGRIVLDAWFRRTNPIKGSEWQNKDGCNAFYALVPDGAPFHAPVMYSSDTMDRFNDWQTNTSNLYYRQVNKALGIYKDYILKVLEQGVYPDSIPTIVFT
jgi:hypothetical protein